MMIVIVGFAALSFDTGNSYLQKRFMQSDSDSAALAGATVLSTRLQTGPPITCAASVMAALAVLQQQQVNINSSINAASANGCNGNYYCRQILTATQYEVVFYQNFGVRSTGFCPMPVSGSTTNLPWVRVDVPPLPLSAVGGGDCALSPFNCMQITSVVKVSTLLEKVFGFSYSDIGISSTAYGGPGISSTSLNTLPANAVNLYGNNVPNYASAANPNCAVLTSPCMYRCDTNIQSTNSAGMPMGLGAGPWHPWAANDRPTLYTCNSNSAGFNGVDGYALQYPPFAAASGSTGVDHLTLVSEGDMVMGSTEQGSDTANAQTNPTPIFDATTFCDPWRQAAAGSQNTCAKYPIPSGNVSCVSPPNPSAPCASNPYLANCGTLPTCPSANCPGACTPVLNPCGTSSIVDLVQTCPSGNQTCSTSPDPPFLVCGTFTVGTRGFYAPSGGGHNLYCNQYEAYYSGGLPLGWPACLPAPGNLAAGNGNPVMQMRDIAGNYSGAFDSCTGCSAHGYPALAAPNTGVGLQSCGAVGLVLNGGAIPAGSCRDPNNPFQIQPGIYPYIVINHGSYTFAPGVYDITGAATVGHCNGGTSAVQPIDICTPQPPNTVEYQAPFNSTSAAVSPCGSLLCDVKFGMGALDPDLCPDANASGITGCSNLTAGVFIQHSGDGPVAANTGTGQQLVNCGQSVPGGGGDETNVSGSGVTFVFESSAGGFVSAHNVSHINFSAPLPGTSWRTGGLPILFYAKGNQFIHLDGGQSPYSGRLQLSSDYASNGFRGIIYQVPSVLPGASGGVEVDSRVGLYDFPVITGQVFARNMLVFGHDPGVVVDFTEGWGPGNTIVVPTASGVSPNEPTEFNGGSLSIQTFAGVNYYWFEVHYFDELPLNLWDVYVTINDGQAIYPSQGLWTNPGASAVPPDPSWTTSLASPTMANWNADSRWIYSMVGANSMVVTVNNPSNPSTPAGTAFQISPDSAANSNDDANMSWGWGTSFVPGNPANQIYNSYTDIIFQTPANLTGNPKFDMWLFDGDNTCTGGDVADVQATLGLSSIISLEA